MRHLLLSCRSTLEAYVPGITPPPLKILRTGNGITSMTRKSALRVSRSLMFFFVFVLRLSSSVCLCFVFVFVAFPFYLECAVCLCARSFFVPLALVIRVLSGHTAFNKTLFLTVSAVSQPSSREHTILALNLLLSFFWWPCPPKRSSKTTPSPTVSKHTPFVYSMNTWCCKATGT